MASAIEMAGEVRAHRGGAVDRITAALAAARVTNRLCGAYIELLEEDAVEQARRVDRIVRDPAAPDLPLAGVPVGIKDNICLDRGRTTCGSRMLENYRSAFSATVARRLMEAGAVVIGKTNLDEFAMGSSTEHSAFGPTRNPWDPSRVPGGSSGGSAAAVAAGDIPVALGSDTGGSIRQPASLCGVVGVKPTYGRVSRYGLVAYASSLDQVGPMAGCVADAALVLDVISGEDGLDSTSASRPGESFTADLERPVDGLVIGVPREGRSLSNHPAVASALERAVEVYRSLGATIVEVGLPMTDHGIAAYYVVACAEASSNLARFDGVRYGRRAEVDPGNSIVDLYRRSRSEGFGAEVKRRILLGTHVLSSGYYDAYYLTALRARRRIKEDFDRALGGSGCHVLLMPAAPGPAFVIGEKTDPLALYMEDVYTVGVNLAGLPAVTIPAGFTQGGTERGTARLPVGVQLIGPAWSEARLLRVARMLERELNLPTVAPAMASPTP